MSDQFRRPCISLHGEKNTNVCVAEGCFGYACEKVKYVDKKKEEPVEQLIIFHTTDGYDFSVNMPIESVAGLLEDFHGHWLGHEYVSPTPTLKVTFTNGRMLHLNHHNVIAIEILNLEDVNARRGSGRPPKKRRRTSA